MLYNCASQLSKLSGLSLSRTLTISRPEAALSREVQKAKEDFGARLREIRKESGLSGRELAALTGWHFTKVSKLENGRQNPSDDDVRTWCRDCRSEEEIPDLLASLRNIESMYVEWRRQTRAGLKRPQKAKLPVYERTKLFRVYEPGLIPGLLQTAGYASVIMKHFIAFHNIPDDLDQAVAARIERQRVLYSGDRRFHIVLEQQALRTRVGDSDTMAGQLDRLITLMSLQRISLGIIPSAAERHTWPSPGFWIFDEGLVQVETVTAELTVTQYREIAVYAKRFSLLQRSAVYGHEARALIAEALAEASTMSLSNLVQQS
jgi:transcriptional regulator with XRE-family HTH domain